MSDNNNPPVDPRYLAALNGNISHNSKNYRFRARRADNIEAIFYIKEVTAELATVRAIEYCNANNLVYVGRVAMAVSAYDRAAIQCSGAALKSKRQFPKMQIVRTGWNYTEERKTAEEVTEHGLK